MKKYTFFESLKYSNFSKYLLGFSYLLTFFLLVVLYVEQRKVVQPAEIQSLKSDPCMASRLNWYADQGRVIRRIHTNISETKCKGNKGNSAHKEMQRKALAN